MNERADGAPRTESKCCECCGREFFKRARDSMRQWDHRQYCSISCRNKSTACTPVHLRFWQFVRRGETSDCWIWTGSKDSHGYGRISSGFGMPPFKAHRISWEMHNGCIPGGNVVCHTCDNPSCVNPNHLVAGSQKENMQQASSRGRLNPKSIMNLRPGAVGFHGAGPLNKEELAKCEE